MFKDFKFLLSAAAFTAAFMVMAVFALIGVNVVFPGEHAFHVWLTQLAFFAICLFFVVVTGRSGD